jgi:hypothetical protein
MRLEQKINYLISPSIFLVKGNLPGLIVIAVAALALVAGFFYNVEATDYGPNVHKGFFFDESSTVSGFGEVSIKGSFHDHAVDSKGWMKGYGSINFESLRSMNKIGKEIDFSQKSDLVFTGGQLKNSKSTRLPLFEKGIGASVSERFNLSHVDKSESNVIRSVNRFNNTMYYDTALAFEGLWGIKNMRGWSINMNKSEQIYSGSFQTQKKIKFDDSAQT